MKKVIYIITTILLCMTSCTDIHDTYSEYIKDGEQIYVGKLADVKIHPGFQRMVYEISSHSKDLHNRTCRLRQGFHNRH
jgi:hypothetical protein